MAAPKYQRKSGEMKEKIRQERIRHLRMEKLKLSVALLELERLIEFVEISGTGDTKFFAEGEKLLTEGRKLLKYHPK